MKTPSISICFFLLIVSWSPPENEPAANREKNTGNDFMVSWNDSESRTRITDFVNSSTDQDWPEIRFINDNEGIPLGMRSHVGKRPVAAFGNSDGDPQILQWTHAGDTKTLIVNIHHTDSVREYAYDRGSHIGKMDNGFEKADAKDLFVVDMAKDWKTVLPE